MFQVSKILWKIFFRLDLKIQVLKKAHFRHAFCLLFLIGLSRTPYNCPQLDRIGLRPWRTIFQSVHWWAISQLKVSIVSWSFLIRSRIARIPVCLINRLLSYPSIKTSILEQQGQARAGAHSGEFLLLSLPHTSPSFYSTFVLQIMGLWRSYSKILLVQLYFPLFSILVLNNCLHQVGGLEVQKPNTEEFHPATPIVGAFFLERWNEPDPLLPAGRYNCGKCRWPPRAVVQWYAPEHLASCRGSTYWERRRRIHTKTTIDRIFL